MKHPYTNNGLVWYDAEEIAKREAIASRLVVSVSTALRSLNTAIQVVRVETPSLMQADWAVGHLPYYKTGKFALRGESTKGTYFVFEQMQPKLPICIYQINKSFRDEESAAIRASKHRYREFYQIEFQLFYSPDTKADYHSLFLKNFIPWHGEYVELPEKDLPPYSIRTTDIEIEGVEVASLSSRKDFKTPVFEMSFGLDRLTNLFP